MRVCPYAWRPRRLLLVVATRRQLVLLVVAAALACACTGGPARAPDRARSGSPSPSGAAVAVAAVAETRPVPHDEDAADDPAIWHDPSDARRSTIIGTDKQGGISVYDLSGRELHRYAIGRPNNVDLRSGVVLGGRRETIVVASDRETDSLLVWRVDPATRGLVDVRYGPLPTGIEPYGLCAYLSPRGELFAFVTDEDGLVQQWRLLDAGGGRIRAAKARQFRVGSISEGCVADDELRRLYVAEEQVGLWRYRADPDGGDARSKVDGVGDGGHLAADVEGLAIYRTGARSGYLIASSQGSDDFVVYRRDGDNGYLSRFSVHQGAVDGVTGTDGIDVTSASLGARFSDGLFVAQDTDNAGENQNFKLVSWGVIARAAALP